VEPKKHHYFVKKVGFHYEIWFHYEDCSIDSASGAMEWRAVLGLSLWRRITAMKLRSDIQLAHDSGWQAVAWAHDSGWNGQRYVNSN
jgi:hypothetical protein